MGNDFSSHVVTFVNPELYVITITFSSRVFLFNIGCCINWYIHGYPFLKYLNMKKHIIVKTINPIQLDQNSLLVDDKDL
jgi:hypothetical protein